MLVGRNNCGISTLIHVFCVGVLQDEMVYCANTDDCTDGAFLIAYRQLYQN